MKYLLYLLATATLILTVGCATIFKGSSADVRLNSSPAGADVFINESDRGSTPQTISLKRNKNYQLEFKKDGYEDVRMEINQDFDIGTTVVGNIFSWGLLGIIVDVASGAAYSLEPADLEANMDELKEAGYIPDENQLDKDDIHVVMLTEEEWEELSAE